MNDRDPFFMSEREWQLHLQRVAMENERNKREKMDAQYQKRRDFYTYGYGSLVHKERMNPFALVDPYSTDSFGSRTLQEEVDRRERLQDSTQVELDSHFFKVDIPTLNQNN